jgi:hypothetical protein
MRPSSWVKRCVIGQFFLELCLNIAGVNNLKRGNFFEGLRVKIETFKAV